MTTNTPNPTSDQTNTQNQMNDLPWQSRTSNKVEPLNSTLPPLGEPAGLSPIAMSTVNTVVVETPKTEQPIQVNQPIGIVQPVLPTQTLEPIKPIEINNPIEMVQPVVAALPVEQGQVINTTQVTANVDTNSTIGLVGQPTNKDPGMKTTLGPALPTSLESDKTNELPGQSLDVTTPLTGKLLPDTQNQLPVQPVDQMKAQTISDPMAANKAKIRNILVIVGVLVAGVAALIFGIFIASNAS